MQLLMNEFNGILVLDEAYIDFSSQDSLMPALADHQNLVILQTFSKAWGLAGIRLGMAFAHEEIIQVLNKIKFPYNVNVLTLQKALNSILSEEEKQHWVETLLKERTRIRKELLTLPIVREILPSDANFLMVRFTNSQKVFKYLLNKGIVIRDRTKESLCEDCLRITIGHSEENNLLLDTLRKYEG